MITGQELIYALLVPVLVAGLLAAIGRWRRWTWAMPLAAGVGFLTGYALLGVPSLPPRDGTDWLFWLAIPLMVLGMVEAWFASGGAEIPGFPADAESTRAHWRSTLIRLLTPWTWTLGAVAGLVALVIMLPLARVGTVSGVATATTSVTLAIAGAVLVLLLRFAAERLGGVTTVAGLCIVLAGAAVIVMASNLRIVGIYGLAGAAALAPVALLSRDSRAGSATCLFAIPVLAGVVVAGRYYAVPGVTWTHFVLILSAPLLLPLAAAIPIGNLRARAVLALAAVAILIGAITLPTAIDAKRAAEDDPYAAYR